MSTEDIYDPQFVSSLFDEMAASYAVVNTISSFGFCHRWRRQCVAQVPIEPNDDVADLMSGMGEMISAVDRRLGATGSIIGIDFSPVMCRNAEKNLRRWKSSVSILQSDALECGLPDQSLDVIVSCFGLKTLSDQQLSHLAREVHRMLRPGGRFSFLEISVPRLASLRAVYMTYLERMIPWIGKLLLGNPDNYRMLGVYTKAFGNCDAAAEYFRGAGLTTQQTSFFLRCATGLVGTRPNSS